MAMQRFYEQTGEYVSMERLLDLLWESPLKDGRRMPLLIWGGAGVGKCVAAESPIIVDGRMIEIGQLWQQYAGLLLPDDSGGEWALSSEPLTVPSISASGKMVDGSVTYLYRQRVQEMGRRVRLDDGGELTMTLRHRLLGVDGWQQKIEVGDRICVPASVPPAAPLPAKLPMSGLVCRSFALDNGARRATATPALAAVGADLHSSIVSRERPQRGDAMDKSKIAGRSARSQREVFYAQVVSVEDVWLNEYVYDLEVAEHHNYVAGGMITHNTQQIKSYAKARGRELMTYHPAHDTTGADIVGKPIIDPNTRETTYAVPSFLPKEGDPDGMLFVDELNRAPDLVLAGLMELFGEGTISQSGWKLPSNWQLLAAANPSELGYQVHELDQAMVDRLLHYAPGWDAPAWVKWASSTGKFNSQVVDFVLANPEMTEIGEAQLPLEIENKLKATPRSWDYFDSLYKPDLTEGMLRVISQGILGRSVAEEFLRKHLGEKPLPFEELLTRDNYDETLQRWMGTAEGEGLIGATTKKMVSALVDRPVEERMTKQLGRYLARLPSAARDEAFALLQRSSFDWLEPLKVTTGKWRHHFAKQNELLGPSGPSS